MGNIRSQMMIIEGVATAISAVFGVGFLGTLVSYKVNEKDPVQRERKVVGAALLTAFMLFAYHLITWVVVGTNDKDLTALLLNGWVYARWAFLFLGGGAAAFSLSKFFNFRDALTWVFTISTALAFGFLIGGTLFSVQPELSDARWVWFALSLASLVAALVAQLFASYWIHARWDWHEAERGVRGFISLWIAVFWLGFPLIWLVGVFGLGNLSVSNHVFENAAYLVLEVLGLLVPLGIAQFSFNPDMGFLKSLNLAGYLPVVHTHPARQPAVRPGNSQL